MKPPDQPSTKELFREFALLSNKEVRRKFLAGHESLSQPDAVRQTADWVREEIRVDIPRALLMADAALFIAESLGDQESLAFAKRAKANVLYAKNEYADAVAMHDQAASLFEAAGNLGEVARTMSTMMQPLLLMSEYDRAFAAGAKAKEIFAKQGNSWRLSRLEINLGNIYYRQDRFAEALACYEKAYRELPRDTDAEGVAAALSNMATCHISLNNFSSAVASYEEARKFCAEHNMPLLVTQADYNIAYLHYLRGEYNKAIQMLRATRTKSKELNDAYHAALCNLDLAELYLELNLSPEAHDLAKQGFEGFQALNMGYEAAKCLAFSAIAVSQQGHAFEGLKLFTEARAIFIKEKNQAWPSLIDLYQALVFFNEGRLFEARHHCLSALESFYKLNLTNKAVLAELLLARIALRTGNLDLAQQHANTAVKSVQELGSPVLSYQAHLLAGNVFSAQDDRDSAYASYLSARESLETLRGNLRGEELKIAFLKNRTEVYENLVEICLARTGSSATEEAFNYIEQAKSRSLMDLLVRPAPVLDNPTSGQSELVRSMRDLREELNWYYNRIEREQLQPEGQTATRVASLQEHAKRREKDLIHMLQEASESDASQAGVQTPTHVPLATIRESISDDTLLVEYFRMREKILVALVGRQTLEIVPITLESRIADLLRLLRFQLSKFRLNPEYVEKFYDAFVDASRNHLFDLHKELIAPIATKLDKEHLVFVPHGLLHYVPFHALHDGTQHLIDRHTISYAPSASIYALSQKQSANASKTSLILGIPDPMAPAIVDEVQALSKVLANSELFVGEEASENVLRQKGPSSRMIHIATHGRFRQDNPMFSAIRLGHSSLSLFDLYQLRLPVDLITLSGCSTGMNVVSPGDELLGLVRGLLYAGARSLMLSLWDVQDESTAEFMTTFYQSLNQGQSKRVALRTAILHMKSRYPHCYQWAAFVLIGQA